MHVEVEYSKDEGSWAVDRSLSGISLDNNVNK